MDLVSKVHNLIARLNKEYREQIFSLRCFDGEEAVITNGLYRYEDNDVDIYITSEEIHGTVSGHRVDFCSEDNVLADIDMLFINEHQ